ncbi:MAG TPA: kelch repeat-containing protein [Thermoplasmata archaeon]|nr:kelch repeat-containing protein [Thermoplasmata archaeon]
MGDHLRSRGPLWVLVLIAVVLLSIPSASAAPAPAAKVPAGPQERTATPSPTPGTTASPSVHPSLTNSAVRPGASAPTHRFPGPRLSAPTRPGPPPSAVPAATKGQTTYDWSSAYIFYGPPPPPANLQLGEGAGWVTDNALNESVMFGGLGQGGLSNITWIYGYYYNASDPTASGEYGGYTNSTTFPSSRTNSTFGAYQSGGVALLFGGLTDLATQSTANDTWLYYFGNDTWINITKPNGPPPREEAAFAIDQTDGIALMFGGIAPKYTSGNSTGTVIWKDTWEFHFATGRWNEITTPTSLGDRFGASMVWDSVSDEFLLVGGCSFSCTMDAWAFSPSNGTWTQIPESGTIPSGRAGASFAWDPNAHRAVLYGGLSFDQNGNPVAYSDTYEFLASGQWTRINPAAPGPAPLYQPGPIYDASTTWSDFPGCDAMWVMGGDPSLGGPPEFVYVIQPSNDTPAFQCWSFLNQVQGPPGAPPPCSRQSQLVVTAQSTIGATPIPNAIVEITGECLPAIGRTGLDGTVRFTVNTPDNISINVSATDFHGFHEWYNYTYTNTTANTSGELTRYVLAKLLPYPSLNVQVFGNTGATFLVHVPMASVILDNFTLVATTGANGWGNDSAVAEFNQTVIVSATATNYSTAWRSVYIPYSGPVNVSLTILRAAWLIVAVLDARTGAPIPGATGQVTRLDLGLPPPFRYTTDALGRYARQLPEGNYSASAQAEGYQANVTGGHAYLPWVTNSTITVRLTPAYGTNESVRLVDAYTGAAIANGTVTFGEDRPIPTNSAGWGNGTDLLPPGRTLVLGRATGYLPNSTTVVLGYNTVLPPITLRLKPSCLSDCPQGASGGGAGGSPFLPVGGSALALLLGAPAFLAIIGALYALAIGARSARQRRGEGTPSLEPA